MRHARTVATALSLLMLLPAAARAQDASAGPTAQERLWDAAIAGDTAAIAAALDAGAVIDSLDTRRNPNGRRALNWAAWHDHVPAVRLLVARGATLEARNHTGFTALHHAAEAGSVNALRELLAAGADPSAVNEQGVSPAETAHAQAHADAAALIADAEKKRQ